MGLGLSLGLGEWGSGAEPLCGGGGRRAASAGSLLIGVRVGCALEGGGGNISAYVGCCTAALTGGTHSSGVWKNPTSAEFSSVFFNPVGVSCCEKSFHI